MNDSSTTVAYVTEASRGVGRLLAIALAEDGARTVGFARPSDELDSVGGQTAPVVPVARDVCWQR
jgi:NAD(P)-dependent dehydrogenase (short-subunit alcohol dehydrogenase family)